ncbi:hypothetical protein Hanom_Chr16g01431621 [Helianthus anomalus]
MLLLTICLFVYDQCHICLWLLPIVMRACFMWNFNLAPKLVLNSKQSLRSAAAGTKRLEPWGTP